MKTTRFITTVIFLALLVGCRTVGPNYSRPAIKAPEGFRGAPDTTVAGAASLADQKWFDVFKDGQLQNLIRTALEQNYDLRDALVRVEAARAGLGLARADQFPAVAASTDVTTSRTSRTGSFPLPQGFEQQRTIGSLGFNLLSFEADVWGRLKRSTEAARARVLASEEDRKTVATILVSDIAGAYFNLLELDSELAIAKRTVATREDSLKLIRSREHKGVSTRLDVRQG